MLNTYFSCRNFPIGLDSATGTDPFPMKMFENCVNEENS